MKKFFTALLTLAVFTSAFSQQQILLLTESFSSGSTSFNLNAAGAGTNTGDNQWVVNNSYSGSPLYPDTPPQDSVVSGTINGAPNSYYLHIHDQPAVVSNGISNTNWNTAAASDRFTSLGSSFCTLGMTNVIFTFFWICEGNTDAYGQVYYRANGGTWTPVGQAKYNNQSKWKYETIQDPAFNNVQNLQIGFRWVNPGTGGATNISFGVDDIIAVGTYDPINNPITMDMEVLQAQICQGSPVIFSFTLSTPLCGASYQIQMSNSAGSFANAYNLGVYNLGPTFTTGTFQTLGTPGNVQGNCFRLRIVRTSPQPAIISDTSACFAIVVCPNLILNLDAPVMNDADTTCIKSVIDVKFNSTGVYFNNNNYIAELSDSTGNFSTTFFLGNLATNDSFPPPSPPFPKGNISGLIPGNVPPGCGYYIRVRSTNPPAVSAPMGPYCLVQCDVLTNNTQDLRFCIESAPYPLCDTLDIDPHHWNNNADYDTCNDWRVELRSMKDFSFVNMGGLGVYHDTAGGGFVICMPPTRNLLPPGVGAGSYYMRIVSDCSNVAWNQTGSVVRIVIGAPDPNPPAIVPPDSVYCGGELASLTVVPWHGANDTSDYEWSSNLLNNGNAFIWNYNPLFINLHPQTTLGEYAFYVREINNGCIGPSSARAEITIIGQPDGVITGPALVCVHDTVNYDVTYQKKTYYQWFADAGVQVLDAGNSRVTLIFDTVGTFSISNFSLNACGSDSGYFTVTVVPAYTVDAGQDLSICSGDSVALHVESDDITKAFLTSDTAKIGRDGAMFNIIAHADVIIDSFAVKFLPPSATTASVEIYGKPGSYRTFESSQFSWNLFDTYSNFPVNAYPQLTVIPIHVNQLINQGDTFAFYVTSTQNPLVTMAYGPGLGITQGVVFKSDGIIDFVQGTANNYAYGSFIGPRVLNVRIYYSTKAGLSYLWNLGDTTETTVTFAPTQSGLYSVLVYDTSGCRSSDSVYVTVNTSPTVNAGPDTIICDGVSYPIPAVTNPADATNIVWNPSEGLSNGNILNPVFTHNESTEYIITILDNNNCGASDTLKIDVKNCKSYLEVPQAFTPNGDGVNDHFTLFGNEIAKYQIQIFNRWGELVYSSTDLGELNDLSRGWDGTYKGATQSLGTFVYHLTATDTYNKSIEKKGNLTLIR